MTPFTFLTDSTGDIDVSRGLQFTPDLATYVVQRLDENLSFFLGEWFLDQRLGIPYFEAIIGQKPDFPLLDSLYRRAVQQTAGVASVSNLVISFEPARRAAGVRFACVLADGTTITEAILRRNFILSYGNTPTE